MRYFVQINLVILLGITAISAQTINAPSIRFAQMEYDFKNVKVDSVLKYVFTFTNAGTDTLKILKVRPGWGCTAVLLSSEEIVPGASGQIEAEYKTKVTVPRFSKSIKVYTNDPNKALIRLTLSGTVEKRVENTEPKKLNKTDQL